MRIFIYKIKWSKSVCIRVNKNDNLNTLAENTDFRADLRHK